MKVFVELWYSFVSMGLNSVQTTIERKNVRLTNTIALSTFILASVYGGIFYVVGSEIAGFMMFPAAFGLLIPVFLNARGKTNSGRVFLIFWYNLCVHVFAIGLGPESSVHDALYAFSLIPWIVFEWTKRRYAFWCSVITIVNFFIIELNQAGPAWEMPEQAAKFISLAISLVIFILLGIFLYSFLTQNYTNENRIRKSLTKLKQAELNLSKLNREQALIIDKVGQQNTRLLNFAHILSHNIRSHSSNLQTLCHLYESEDERGRLELIGMAKKSIDALNETIEDINMVLAIHNNKNLPFTYCDLNEIVGLKISQFSKLHPEIVMDCQLQGNTLLHSNREYIEDVLSELLDNAVNYKNPNRPLEIAIHGERQSMAYMLTIKDNGSGIDLKAQGHRVFGLYKTFHDNANSKGLGLYLVKNKMEAIEGRVEIESQLDEGTLFRLFFRDKH